jgi:hypothetical protein
MAGPITIKLTETLSEEQLYRRVTQGWNEAKYGKPQVKEVNSRQYTGFEGSPWISVLAYPGRNKIVIQSMPANFQIAFTKEGKKQLKHVNKDVLPVIAEGFRELLADILK